MDAAVDTYGGLDCAFNNAGLDLNVGVADATVKDFAAAPNRPGYITGVTLPVDGGFLLYNAGSP